MIEWPLTQQHIMGILNVTPDSFADGGSYTTVPAAVEHAYAMVQAGATIIDIGGESSRPGAEPINEEEELARVLPVIETIRASHLPELQKVTISIDTTKPAVAQFALNVGANWVNDIGGLRDPLMRQVVAKYSCPVVVMHMQGEPTSMQTRPHYDNVVTEVTDFFKQQIKLAREAGIAKEQLILDPGIGFGKTDRHNIALLNNITAFTKLGLPVLIGASRKSLIGRLAKVESVTDRLPGTLAIHWHALQQGASIIRVHDVAEHKQVLGLSTVFQP